ncbi:MAG: 2-oxo-4-hydroxy-4-carboxy-5-ureidoimidazoline decarboxylase [Gemmatimonadaceae bacterium]
MSDESAEAVQQRVGDFNTLSDDAAAGILRSCCGSSRWVAEMIARRPFASIDSLLIAADEVWASTDAVDWHEAFAHHPRIGGKETVDVQSSRASAWSAAEQAATSTAGPGVQAELVSINQQYENRFGHIYIVRASGRSAEEMLTLARQRLLNDPESELLAAAEEQRQITRLRLRKQFGGDT